MPLLPSTRFGQYEVIAPLGAGGMGEVYRARDTKLQRDVALKILPELFAADPERLARFRREAQVLASLNHPHIGAIYGLEEQHGLHALVLELVDGPTLAERIARGPIPLEEALPIARQMTEAIEAAHEQGIVHRDLKPANIKLRPDGVVKILDFGLAKALDPAPGSVDMSQSPTITSPAITQIGVILGTAAYMSPEQAKGRVAGKRSDIWAFGCVLFEMLSGQRAFGGEDGAETLAHILTKEPPWASLPPDTPASIRRVLYRCLEKDRARRLADIADARLELADHLTEGAGSGTSHSPATLRHRLLWWTTGAFVASILWFAGVAFLDRPADDTRVVRSSIPFPGRLGARWGGTLGANLALSPDGRRVAFVATDSTGRRQLWLRNLDAIAARPLAGTEDAITPFWSPDSRWLAFVANGKLRKLDPMAGPVVTLCETAQSGGTWSREDIILFTESTTQSLARVPAAGGAPTTVTAIDTKANEVRHVFPHFLPDGRHFVYVATGFADMWSVYVASFDRGKITQLPVEGAFVQYARGFLFFARGSTLMAQPFDERRLAFVGDAIPVVEQVRADNTQWGCYFSVSATGTLVYQEDLSPGYELVWYDRAGRRMGTLGTAADYTDVSLSPDGQQVLVSIAEPGTTNRDLWIFDVVRGLRTRFTTGSAPEMHNVWSPDGDRIAFDSRRRGHRDMYVKAATGVGSEELLVDDEFDKNPVSWSPDGRFILYIKRSAGAVNLWVLPLGGDRKPFPFRENQFLEVPGRFSPDGRWVTFGSTESGRMEIYVAPFPGPGGKSQISTAGGINPVWRRDGKEIFYLSNDDMLMVASVSAGGDRFDVGTVESLFELPRVGPRISYDVSPDGQRILSVMRKAEPGSTPLTLVVNWPALVKR